MDELFMDEDEEWIEISDDQGHRAALRHLAMIRDGSKVYHVLGAFSSLQDDEEDEEGGLFLIREDLAADGAQEYVVASDEEEIERVIGSVVLHAIALFAASQEEEPEEAEPCSRCGQRHAPGEFCACGDPKLLQ